MPSTRYRCVRPSSSPGIRGAGSYTSPVMTSSCMSGGRGETVEVGVRAAARPPGRKQAPRERRTQQRPPATPGTIGREKAPRSHTLQGALVAVAGQAVFLFVPAPAGLTPRGLPPTLRRVHSYCSRRAPPGPRYATRTLCYMDNGRLAHTKPNPLMDTTPPPTDRVAPGAVARPPVRPPRPSGAGGWFRHAWRAACPFGRRPRCRPRRRPRPSTAGGRRTAGRPAFRRSVRSGRRA